MQSLLAKTKTFLTPVGSSANLQKHGEFRTEKQAELLFQQTDPKIDGEDCLHDCASCTETLPRKWSIDEDDKLYGHVNGWETHLVVGTGKTDWVRDVTEEKGSVMQAVGKIGLDLKNGKLMLSASDLPPHSDHDTLHHGDQSHKEKKGVEYPDNGRTRCIVLPKWEMVENIGIHEAQWLLEDVIAQGPNNAMPLPKHGILKHSTDESTVQKEEQADAPDIDGLTMQDPKLNQPVPEPANGEAPAPLEFAKAELTMSQSRSIPQGVTIRPLQHRAIILMCSHGTRDWRCGKSAPILRRELERHLRPLGLYRDFDDERPGGVGIYYINHVGGHKYSANFMIYRREGRKRDDGSEELSGEAVQGIWLARVRPEDCENIVRYTVLQGKVVKPQRQLRGGFDRERGVLSW